VRLLVQLLGIDRSPPLGKVVKLISVEVLIPEDEQAVRQHAPAQQLHLTVAEATEVDAGHVSAQYRRDPGK
jgi:hypothetical protein